MRGVEGCFSFGFEKRSDIILFDLLVWVLLDLSCRGLGGLLIALLCAYM